MSTANVVMVRPNLAQLPAWVLPDGYRLRGYRPGDVQTWVALHQDAEPYVAVTAEHFERSFGAHPQALPDRMFFVETLAGEPAGSITAWWQADWRGAGDWGQIHWVIVAQAHQRRGLAKAMMAHALRRLAAGHDRAMLETNTARAWAIKLYLDSGFAPDPLGLADAQVRAAWRELQDNLHHPALAGLAVDGGQD